MGLSMRLRGWLYQHLLLPRSLQKVNAAIIPSTRYLFVDAQTWQEAVDFLTATRGGVEMWRNPRLHGDMVEWDRGTVLINAGTARSGRFVAAEGWNVEQRRGGWIIGEETDTRQAGTNSRRSARKLHAHDAVCGADAD